MPRSTASVLPMPRPTCRPFHAITLLVITLLAVAPWTWTSFRLAQAAGDCAVPGAELAVDGEEQAMLIGINAYRAAAGLAPWELSPTLTRAASWMSHDMATMFRFGHTDSLLRSFDVRLADCGYTFHTGKGENLAAGHADAASTLNQWKNSPPHNALLLNPGFGAAGIGRHFNPATPYDWYWTLNAGGFVDDGPW